MNVVALTTLNAQFVAYANLLQIGVNVVAETKHNDVAKTMNDAEVANVLASRIQLKINQLAEVENHA